MRCGLLLTCLGACGLRVAVAAPPEKGLLGVGLMVGEPTGLVAKYYLRDDRALAAGVGMGLWQRGLVVHGDYLWHPVVLEQRNGLSVPLYVGVGARLRQFDPAPHLGEPMAPGWIEVAGRGVAGLLFEFHAYPLDGFIEVAASAGVRTGPHPLALGISGGMGVRYYF